ncbi:MAG: Luciferase-like, subgroup [Caulobacteraceae bacterium]|jgi:alkanesulfonate monooxygenase SsuD/methylene tetrahydromethanopterin reductase-like flavin-dependent oxidoreductase (luciferase family)|nr:Luciferase-like, subgroup [Caulobacteraceae bacterium]
MHVGLGLCFQALDGKTSDKEVYRFELGLAARAEAAGFNSIWTPEHHFSDYQMTPNVPQFLAWVAGQTRTIRLGTMVTVLPWHDPVRVAENFVLLDHLSEGRAIVGLGRGLGRIEFTGFRAEMGESRRRFTEYTEAILSGLESGVMQFDGELYKQPPVRLRPAPYASFRGRTFASAISPASIDLMARLGVGLMVIAQKPWPQVVEDLTAYRRRFLEINGHEAPKPILAVFVATHEDPVEAQRMREIYIQRYARSTVEHYEFGDVSFADIEGYEYYAGLARNIAKHGLEKFNGFLADLQVWGTPDAVVEKLTGYVDQLQAGGLLLLPSYGGMPNAVAQANYDLIARKVVPALLAHDVGGDLGVAYEPELQYVAAE